MTLKLMIKKHNKTGLKYLCFTKTEGIEYDNYKGSGKHWLRHLKKHGSDISTTLIYETDSPIEFKEYAIQKSKEYNIIESKDWANIRIEDGAGGDTVSNKKWITNGSKDKYILKTEEIPGGWKKGRSNCVFNNKENQSKFSKKSDRVKAGKATSQAWKEGRVKRDNSKCGIKGDLNPAKRPEVREKMKQAALKDSKGRSERMKLWRNKK